MKFAGKSCALRALGNATTQLSQLRAQLGAQPDRNRNPDFRMTATELRAQLRRNRAEQEQRNFAAPETPKSCFVVIPPASPATATQPTPWPGCRRWRICRANGEAFNVQVPQGATIPEMTAFYVGCTCIPTGVGPTTPAGAK